jgi:hypothetical protein
MRRKGGKRIWRSNEEIGKARHMFELLPEQGLEG